MNNIVTESTEPQNTTSTPRRCDDPAPHEAHSYYAPTGHGSEHRETFCNGVPKRLPSCPDWCGGLHYGDGWEGMDDSGVPWRTHSGGPWESIPGGFYSAEVYLTCEERYGEGLGPTLVRVESETSLTPADAIRLAEHIRSAARVAESTLGG